MVQGFRGMGRLKGAKSLAEFNPNTTDIALLLTKSRSAYGEGCLNEPMRIFSDIAWNEDIINNLVGIDIDTTTTNVIHKSISEYAVQQTLERMSNCVIGILERPNETIQNLNRYLPWLGEHIYFGVHNNTGGIKKGDLSREILNAIDKVSTYERFVYDIANQLLDKQLATY
jgi:hypothetical protein